MSPSEIGIESGCVGGEALRFALQNGPPGASKPRRSGHEDRVAGLSARAANRAMRVCLPHQSHRRVNPSRRPRNVAPQQRYAKPPELPDKRLDERVHNADARQRW